MLCLSRVCSARTADFKRIAYLQRSHVKQSVIRPTTSRLHVTATAQTKTMTVIPAALEGLEPQRLWSFFAGLSAIPRPSKHESKVITWLIDYAKERGLDYQQDSIGNMVIRRPGSGGGEAAPPVIIQGHIDMVTEKNADTVHDFMTDGIKLVRDGDWITADGTTLGADNGIGVCAALAVLDLPQTAKLPPIEALFTIDEETGLTGAFELDGSMLKGRTMLNLDTEDWGDVFIGCAGGGDSYLTLTTTPEPLPTGHFAKELKVEGLMGGHSGINIHHDRGNAVKIATSLVESLLSSVPETRVSSMAGGDKRNAIPRECAVVVTVPSSSVEKLEAAVSAVESEFQREYGHLEKSFNIAVSDPPTPPTTVMSGSDVDRLTTLLSTLPHGVIKYSHAVPGLVETSTNLASVRPQAGSDGSSTTTTFRIDCCSRSSMMAPLERCRANIKKLATLCGAEVEQDKAYPGWEPQPDAEIVSIVQKAIGKITGEHPPVKAVHAGLECGIIGEKLPGCQSVSYGPTITGAHSPDERVQISTVKPFWEATVKVLEELADKRA